MRSARSCHPAGSMIAKDGGTLLATSRGVPPPQNPHVHVARNLKNGPKLPTRFVEEPFSIDRTSGSQRQKKLGAETNAPTGMQPPTPEPKWYSIAERAGGFTVS